MKKLLLTICTILCANVLLAQSPFLVGQLYYIPTSSNEVSVSGYNAANSPTDLDIPSTVTNNGITYTVTSIGNGAFLNNGEDVNEVYCASLTSVTIPNTVTSIGNVAFKGCYNLISVDIPNSVTSIGESAFSGCTHLSSITIPNSVTSIGKSAFAFCEHLTSAIISNSLTTIAEEMFFACGRLTEVTIPNGVVSIGAHAFRRCGRLTEVTIPNGVVSIGAHAFRVCSSLTEVTIPSSVISIGDSAFFKCINLTSVVSLRDPAPAIGVVVFDSTHSSITLTIPFNAQEYICTPVNAKAYTSDWGSANWQKIYHKINQGEIKPLSNTFEITNENRREVINDGVLVIEQGGELVNQTTTNVRGIIEVKTKSLPNNKWSFIGAPFAEYKLETVVPGANDISISEFNYATGNWREEWATIDTVVGAGEGLFAWSFASEPTIFTNYGDGMYSPSAHSSYNGYNYDYSQDPAYTLNNSDVEVTKTLITTNGGNWMALANPYTFKLDVARFLNNQANIVEEEAIQGKVLYRLNANNTWSAVNAGVIDVTEGFFVNFTSNGSQTATFNKGQYYDPTQAKASAEREYVRLAMLEGEREIEVLFAQNDQANENYDIFDANKLFSPIEIAEPYFVVNNIALVKEEVNTLPYYATMNVRSFGSKEVTFKVNYIPEGLAVSIIDGEETIDLGEGVEYTTNIIAGENADRFKVLIKKSLSISDAEELEVNIYNDNRHINIETLENDLQVEVYNALGQKVLSTKDRNFTLNQVSAGAYLIKAFNNKASKTQKILVK
ncbi:MAG: leucine-rich repeat protein [Bacteroidales bacterium]|nr:leucine-rich repeat protein [Bacteroidales bacterium]